MILACCLAVALAATTPADEADLLSLERTWNEAHLQGDATALDRLWADDFVVIVPRMQPITRADALAMARSGRIHFERYESSDVKVRLYGDTAVVTGRLRRTRTTGDRRVEDDWMFTKVYERRDGAWKVGLFQASDGPPPEPSAPPPPQSTPPGARPSPPRV